jgi:hypothetical protein
MVVEAVGMDQKLISIAAGDLNVRNRHGVYGAQYRKLVALDL